MEKDGHIVGGCGIGPVKDIESVCEWQKMYSYKEIRGTSIAQELLERCLAFAKSIMSNVI